MKTLQAFWNEEDAIGVVEIILILVVLVGLVIIFRNQIQTLINNVLAKIQRDSAGL